MRLSKGNLDLESLRYLEAQRKIGPGILEDVILLSVEVVSSQRALTQTCTLMFSKGNRTNWGPLFLPPPLSRCTCEAGRYCCSHLVAILMALGSIQPGNDTSVDGLCACDWDLILKVYPLRIKLGTSILVPLSVLYPLGVKILA